MKRYIKSSENKNKLVRIARLREFDNGNVIHDDWKYMNPMRAEYEAKRRSLKDPTDGYYVQYDDIMSDGSDIVWVEGVPYNNLDINVRADHIEIDEDAIPMNVNPNI